MSQSNNVSGITKLLFSWQGVSFLLLAFMLLNKINGGGQYMIQTMMMCFCILPVYKKRYWDKMASVVVSFSVYYVIMLFINSPEANIFYLLFVLVTPVFFYLYGKILVDFVDGERWLIAFWWVVALALAAKVYSIVGFNGTFTVNDQRILETSENSEEMATTIGTYVSLGLVGLGTLIFSVKNLWSKLLWGVVFVLSVAAVVFMTNRTGLFVATIITVLMALFKGQAKIMKTLLYLLSILAIILFVSDSSIIDSSVISAYQSRSESMSTGGDRLERWSMGVKYLFEYPWGWSYRSDVFTGFAHNMWLDAAGQGGIICFVLLVWPTWISAKQLRFMLQNNINSFTLFVFGLYMCFFLSCMVEPLLQSLFVYFLLFVLLWGMISQYNVKSGNVRSYR